MSYSDPMLPEGDLTVVFYSGNRLTEFLIVKQTEPGVPPEVGTTFEIKIYGESDQLLNTFTITGTDVDGEYFQEYPNAQELTDTGKSRLEFRLAFHITAIRDDLRSETYIREGFRVDPASFTTALRTEDSEILETEAGDILEEE